MARKPTPMHFVTTKTRHFLCRYVAGENEYKLAREMYPHVIPALVVARLFHSPNVQEAIDYLRYRPDKRKHINHKKKAFRHNTLADGMKEKLESLAIKVEENPYGHQTKPS